MQTPRANRPDIQIHYVNVDTGCYIEDGAGYGKLSAYCVETGEVMSVNAKDEKNIVFDKELT